MTPLLLTHLLACAVMTGVIWETQRVHYPMFKALGDLPPADFEHWMLFHTRRITGIVGPVMLFEAATGLWLVWAPPPGFPPWLGLVNIALLGLIFAATVFWSIPNHHALRHGGFRQETIQALITSNWVRTLAWTCRLLLLTAWLLR